MDGCGSGSLLRAVGSLSLGLSQGIWKELLSLTYIYCKSMSCCHEEAGESSEELMNS